MSNLEPRAVVDGRLTTSTGATLTWCHACSALALCHPYTCTDPATGAAARMLLCGPCSACTDVEVVQA